MIRVPKSIFERFVGVVGFVRVVGFVSVVAFVDVLGVSMAARMAVRMAVRMGCGSWRRWWWGWRF